ncbi:MAG: tyrosine--tRNA ligase [Alphaproteobacteria bacterium]|nr:tyrosine--tRNA ligase [Alphaproteobacteria bacterium]
MSESAFLKTCETRGFINQCTDLDGFDAELTKGKPIAAYIGFDCTATSLHVGSLIQIMLLRHWQKAGHKPIVLMGGGTTKVGDPTGKDKSRVALTDEQIAINMAGIKTVFEKFITFGDGPTDAVMVNNDDWLSGLKYLEFLRDFGRHFSINRMLTMDSVKLRLEREQPLSFLEFNYMILQGYDFYHLADSHAVRAQFGGSDQWGNIVQGTELSRRILAEKGGKAHDLFGMTTPLFTNAAGAKMGKTADGAVWLNADMFSPYDYWQFWRNAEDAMVGKYLRWFTDLPIAEIGRLESLEGSAINDAKKVLATEATKLLHGEEAALQAAETAQKTFELGLTGDALPEITIDGAELSAGIAFTELLFRAEMTPSKGEAKKLIQGGGAKLNDEKVSDVNLLVSNAHLNAEGFIKLSAGKKRHALVKPA